MNDCDYTRSRIGFYVDDELRGAELADFENHLNLCTSCRSLVNHELRFFDAIRNAAPLYTASEELHHRASSVVNNAPAAYRAPDALRNRVGRRLLQSLHPGRQVWSLATAVVLATMAVGAWYFGYKKPVERVGDTSAFALMAADTHARRVSGQLPFEITSDSPQEISQWFAGKVSFGLKLPNYQESSGQDRLYNLEGARLVALNNDYAAYVGYRMGARPISLVVTSTETAQPTGGTEIIAQGLTFHYDTVEDLKVITWTDRGLTYALVSSLEERGQQSCIVCHAGTKDRDFIDGLKPAH
ncbi:MAG TPA: zf-HC2 domain-containing protein [Blastocatellia bacterium]|nr:zf-HC2 domain-containing protein [Blastocatellia bacterium]